MKEKRIFNNKTCPTSRNVAYAAINVNSGGLTFNPEAVEELSLNRGARVSFEMEEKELFVRIDDEDGIDVMAKKNGRMTLNRVSLKSQLQKAVGAPRFRLELGNFSDGRWPLKVIIPNKN